MPGIEDALDTLKGMLDSEDGKEQLNSLINSITGDSDSLPGIGSLLGGMGGNSAALLAALKPYLNEKRHGYIDSAIQIMSLAKAAPLLELFKSSSP